MILNNEARALIQKLRDQGEFDAAAFIEMLELGFARLSLSAATLFDEESVDDDDTLTLECEDNWALAARLSTCPKTQNLFAAAQKDAEDKALLMSELFPHAADVPKRWSELKPLLFKAGGNGH